MRCTCVTGKLPKHSFLKSVMAWNGGDPSMLRPSITLSSTGRSGCVIGWAATFWHSAPPPGSTASTYLPQSQRDWLARK